MLWKALKQHLNAQLKPEEWPEVFTLHQTSLTFPIRHKGCRSINQIRLWHGKVEHTKRCDLPYDEEVYLTGREAAAMANLLNGNLYFVSCETVDGKEFYSPRRFSSERSYEVSFSADGEDSFYESYEDALNEACRKNGLFK